MPESLMVTMLRSRRHSPLQMQYWDISRALFYETAHREVYVGLPEEEQDDEHCGRLVKSMYGTQDAFALWQEDYTQSA